MTNLKRLGVSLILGMVASLMAGVAAAQLFPGDPLCDEEGEDFYYCEYANWAGSTPFHLKRVTISDNGIFGFSTDVVTPMSVESGAANGNLQIFFDRYQVRMDAMIEGREVKLDVIGGCTVAPFPGSCTYRVTTLHLVSGWILDNGLDFSGQSFEFDYELGDVPIIAEGYGSSQPFYPFSFPDNNGEPIGTFYPLLGHNVAEKDVEDYFGIRVEVEMDRQAEEIFVPEADSAPMLASGFVLLAVVSSMRQSRRFNTR